jgi:hypothetical protein
MDVPPLIDDYESSWFTLASSNGCKILIVDRPMAPLRRAFNRQDARTEHLPAIKLGAPGVLAVSPSLQRFLTFAAKQNSVRAVFRSHSFLIGGLNLLTDG